MIVTTVLPGALNVEVVPAAPVAGAVAVPVFVVVVLDVGLGPAGAGAVAFGGPAFTRR
jgi:hypothetical protein